MKKFAIIAALTMVTTAFPMAAASHLSIGYMTTAGMGPEETPENPSVVGDEVGDKSTPYGVGTSEQCYDADGNISEDNARAAAAADAVCGKLVYNAGMPSLKRYSPPDQDIPTGSPIGTFDVQVAYSHPAGFVWGTCTPFCKYEAWGPTVWNATHTAGEVLGITDGPGEADEKEGNRRQIQTQDVSTPNAFTFIQHETGIWEMNGWAGPPPTMERVIAFIEDENGEVIDNTRLNNIIQKRVDSGELSKDTVWEVCGMRGDATLSSGKDLTYCEIKMYFQAPGNDGFTDTKFDGYGDKCNSPSYVCAASGPYWRSRNVGLLGTFSGASPVQTGTDTLHFFIAPHNHECPHVTPNGIAFESGEGFDDPSMPYLAHELEVYTQPGDFDDTPKVSIQGLDAYSSAVYSKTVDDTFETYREVLDTIPSVPLPEPPSVPETPEEAQPFVDEANDSANLVFEEASGLVTAAEDAVDGTGQFTENSMIEPNNGDPIDGIPDNSRTVISEDRSSDLTPCQEMTDRENDDTRDPWVNLLDAKVSAENTGGYEPYGNADSQRDNVNRPGPDFFHTRGKIGVFTDKNDDGDYDRVGGEVWQASNIQSRGAYPMMWDMRLDADAEAPTNRGGGCAGPGGGFSSAMEKAGYGPRTALAQAIYLREPTVFADVNTNDPRTVSYPGGNNIYLLTNQAGRVLWDGDIDTQENLVDARIDALASNLKDYVVDEHDADPSSLEIIRPGEALDRGSDFGTQCGESTGSFTSALSFKHYCQASGSLSCDGDTIATMYTFEVNGTDTRPNTLGGGQVPELQINGQVYEFGAGQHTWFDVDPFDNDADRNEQQMPRPPR